MRWSSEADEVLSRVPTKHQREVVRHVEKATKANRGAEVCLVREFFLFCLSSGVYVGLDVQRIVGVQT